MNEKIGADTSYRTQGRVEALADEKAFDKSSSVDQNSKRNCGIWYTIKYRIKGEELSNRLVGAQTPWTVAAFEEDSGSVDPETGTPALARHAKRWCKIYTNCAVRGIETAGGKISDVVTEKGAIRTSHVVLAGGIWSRLFMGNMGIDIQRWMFTYHNNVYQVFLAHLVVTCIRMVFTSWTSRRYLCCRTAYFHQFYCER